MSLEDIEKLKARLEKDPDSKLFLPLAEEYRKEGMYDEAIEVLKKGLERHPRYPSARVLLAKVFIDKGQLDEARTELEQVIDSVPDNLFAQRKLAEIYKDMGLKDKAIEHFKRVVELNPLDEEAIDILNQLKGVSDETITEEVEEGPVVASEEVDEAEAIVEDVKDVIEETEEIEALEEEEAGYEEDKGVISDLEPGAIGITEEGEQEEDHAPSFDFDDYKEFAQFINEEVYQMKESEESYSFRDAEDTPMFATDEYNSEDYYADTADALESAERELFHIQKDLEEKDIEHLLSEADELIKNEKYGSALDIYMGILNRAPDNRQVKQRTEELKQFLKLIGKDSELVIKRLESFLDGLRRRRDEFFGSS